MEIEGRSYFLFQMPVLSLLIQVPQLPGSPTRKLSKSRVHSYKYCKFKFQFDG